MKFLEMMKRFLSLDEVEDSVNKVNPLTSSEEKWKALALELNKELQRFGLLQRKPRLSVVIDFTKNGRLILGIRLEFISRTCLIKV
ncbi:TPA: hypothetical protein U1185_001048 [Streptococcus suis]|nr:hypothetical protein [Streptococcus suis]